ncbi:uncharacterized protein [Macrobrachium rosenbergii]|uniref:uncharacterized protein n=1 Tax=Macrobrachium rosenbergii TaxID=79674 RepID=UPI0034D5D5B6
MPVSHIGIQDHDRRNLLIMMWLHSRTKVDPKCLEPFAHLNLADEYGSNRKIQVDMLIGLDLYWKLMLPNKIVCHEGLVAQETVFGWVLSGSSIRSKDNCDVGVQLLTFSNFQEDSLSNFWDLESVGIQAQEPRSDAIKSDPILVQFEKLVSYKEGRYEVALPWKSESVKLKLLDNKHHALRRLDNLSRKLDRDPGLQEQYYTVFEEYEKEGIIEEIPPHQLEGGYPVFYLPHRPVVREVSISTKIRPVFDGSARGSNGVSLNDCLESGPSLNPDLVEVLLRFRRWRVALTADITKAFLQIKVRRRTVMFTGFLEEKDIVKHFRFVRVPFGNKSSPFLLNATLKFHLKKYPPSEVVSELLENLYVDDWLSGAASPAEACARFDEACGMLKKAGMCLSKCTSNYKTLPMTEDSIIEGVKVIVLGDLPAIELHAFGDASERGYGACVYVRVPEKGNFKVTLIAARAGGPLTYGELMKAKVKLLYCAQREAFAREINALALSQPLPKGSPLVKLDPYLDEEGLLRIKGRLENAELSFESKHPIIVPGTYIALLLVRFQHGLLKHAGVAVLVSTLRNNYWIIRLRQIAKRVCRECVACRRCEAKACSQPVAPLPELRVKAAPPFTVTGLDFAGPLFCVDFPSKKLYILLFTCAVVRAVHLELTESLSVTDCNLAIRRFTARRGVPSVFYSDNAKNLLGVSNLLKQHYGPMAPNGSLLYLMRLGEEPDVANPLTPSHFLIGRSAGFQVELADDSASGVTSKDLCVREAVRLSQLEKFWNIWQSEYLRNLPCMVKGFKANCNLTRGSVVIVKEERVPRLLWPLGVITEVCPGKDGMVRSAKVKTKRGFVTKPVQNLYNLEISDISEESVCYEIVVEVLMMIGVLRHSYGGEDVKCYYEKAFSQHMMLPLHLSALDVTKAGTNHHAFTDIAIL